MDAKTRMLVEKSATEAKQAQPEANAEGWTAIAPPSIDKLRKAREKAMELASAELLGPKGMRIPDAGDREILREITSILREVLVEAA